MKKFKSILAMIMAFVMIMGMSTMAFAAGEANEGGQGEDPIPATTKTITVNLPAGSVQKVTVEEETTGNTEVFYDQIIKEDMTNTLGWEIVDEFEAAFVEAFLGDAEIGADIDKEDLVIAALIQLGVLEETDNKYAGAGDVNTDVDVNNEELAYVAVPFADAENLANALAAVQNALSKPATVVVENEIASATITVEETAIGLYAIKVGRDGYTFIPMSVYVGTDYESKEVVAKGAEDQVKKTVEGTGQSVSKGDTVTYTVTVEYPYYAKSAEGKSFVVTDTLTNATFTGTPVEIEVGTKTLEAGKDYEEVVAETDDKLTITFVYDYTLAGEMVTITYDVVVGDVTSAGSLSNKVESKTDTKTTEQIVNSDTVDFTVIKLDDRSTAENKIKLEGAEFTLYEEVSAEEAEKTIVFEGKNVNVKSLGTMTTDENGEATWNNLDADDTYYVQETKAPKGYSLNDKIEKLTGAELDEANTSLDQKTIVDGVTVLTSTYKYIDFDDIEVLDTKLLALPSTGGIGTTIFTVAGCAIMIAAAGFFFASRKKEEE